MGHTIYDVAKEAGVSIATVSKVVNGNGRISDKTRKHVKEVMAKLNYQPSTIASALTSKRTYTLGIIVPNIANPFFGEVTRIIEKYAHESGYAMMVCSTYNEIERETQNIQLLLRQQIDGMIIATEQISNEALHDLNNRNIPVVKFSAFSDSEDTVSISTNNYAGGQKAAAYLFDNGHRDIWIIGEKSRHSEQQRIAGFQDYFAAQGHLLDDTHVFHTNTEYEDAIEVVKQLLAQKQLPTAIFVTTDIVAIILMNIAQQLGVRVPEDVSVVGFDNTIFAQLSHPQLTTIAQPVNEMGKLAVKSLIEMIDGKLLPPFEITYFEPKLIERATVRRLEG